MSLLESIHETRIVPRRARVLSAALADLFPRRARVLDVGCGDGRIAAKIRALRPDLDFRGIDTLVRQEALIPVESFDGKQLPFEDRSFDAIAFVDVLHHADAPLDLLCEARRVSRDCVILKDHLKEGLLAGPTLRIMDRVGNRRHGVALPHNYWVQREWDRAFRTAGLEVAQWRAHIGLYPWPASLIFERGLHFVAKLSARPDESS